jgi:Cd2+/Zn2+-exporting ATPase
MACLVAIIPPLAINLHSGNVWFTWVGTAVTILIISCPCALVISVPLSFFAGMGVASKYGILMKNAQCIEALAQTDIIVFDKTGTLTQGKFKLNEIKMYSSKFEANEILKMVTHLEYHSNHPIAYSIKEAYKGEVDLKRVTQLETFHGEGLTGCYDKQYLIIGNEKIMKRFNIDITTCHCAHTHLYVAVNKEFMGFIDVGDHIKEDAMQTIQTLNSMHIEHMILLTGDSKYTAADISNQLGIKEFHADLLPEDKVRKLNNIIKTIDNTHVAFVGDGVNDAPVLASANVGIAMGSNGSAVAVEAADVVLMNDKPSKIPLAIKVAKRVIRTAHQNIVLAICTKLIVLILTLVAGI